MACLNSPKNVGLCSKCQGRVPAEFFNRDGQIWIRKNCPTCGLTESLVSSDAEAWLAKRDLWEYVPSDPQGCTLKCDKCRTNHKPNLLFVDVTNHCNMNCPICIASVPAMGFDFNPPIEYFEKIFAHASKWDPKPVIQLFGGEPTVRDDLFEIVAVARKYGLRPNVTTNGLRLADEEYAKKFCAARLGVRFAFDGNHPDVYEKLRHNRPAYEKKVKGLENLKKYSQRKQAIISCIARGINDQYVGGMIQYIHDNRGWISELLMIPLAETWDPEVFKEAACNTLEDTEKIVQESIGGNEVAFIPAGLSYAARTAREFFASNPRSEVLLLAGVHPNCESMTLLISDGKRYRGVNHYLKVPFQQAAKEFAALCAKIEPQLKQLDPKNRFQRLRGQWLLIRTFAGWVRRSIKVLALCDYNPLWAGLKMLGAELKHQWARLTTNDVAKLRRKRRVLRVAMLPFEEQHSVDAGRLEHCKSVFAYEDEEGAVQTIPACMWPPYRDVVLRKVAEKYGAVDKKGRPRGQATAVAEGKA